jgi:hypothetical protein
MPSAIASSTRAAVAPGWRHCWKMPRPDRGGKQADAAASSGCFWRGLSGRATAAKLLRR